jgi:hypothetical protein
MNEINLSDKSEEDQGTPKFGIEKAETKEQIFDVTFSESTQQIIKNLKEKRESQQRGGMSPLRVS